MKKIFSAIVFLSFVTITNAQQTKPVAKPSTTKTPVKKPIAAASTFQLKTLKDSVSYVLGMNISENFGKLDLEAFKQGFNDHLQNKKELVSSQLSNDIINTYMQQLQSQKASANKIACQNFLTANAKKQGVITLADGLQYEVLKAGTDTVKPKATDRVKVHYHGTLIDGTIFDSSVDRGEPVVFGVNEVVIGWQEVLQLMTVGSKWKVYLPSNLAYGDSGNGKIGPGAALIFTMELLGIEK
jgi:FKBP-type peptidyl-prolyl cis-trans isomerase FklB